MLTSLFKTTARAVLLILSLLTFVSALPAESTSSHGLIETGCVDERSNVTGCLGGDLGLNDHEHRFIARQSSSDGVYFDPPNLIVQEYMRQQAPAQRGLFYNVEDNVLNQQQIQDIAAKLDAVSLYDVYQPDNVPNAPFNRDNYPMRYYKTFGAVRQWFRYTSRVFVQVLRTDTVYLIWDGKHPFTNTARAQQWTAIWASDEFDAIIRGQTSISRVFLVNPANGELYDPATGQPPTKPYWERGMKIPDDWSHPLPGARSESDDTANPNPNGPVPGAPPNRKREPESQPKPKIEVAIKTSPEPEAEPEQKAEALELFNKLVQATGGFKLKKRVPNVNGIEQVPDRSAFSPGQDGPYLPGICSFHFVQTVLGDVGIDFFNITLFDAEQTNWIGGTSLRQINVGDSYAMPSRLPYTLVIMPGRKPQDSVTFKYANLGWSSSDGNCKTGGYDGLPNGSRQGDCSFLCSSFQ